MEDEKIVQLYLERNDQAIPETADKYGNYCFSIAKNILENKEDVKECIRRGICKVNYATDLRIAFTEGVKEVLEAAPDTIDPKKYNAKGREKVKEYVMGRMKVCGSVGKA